MVRRIINFFGREIRGLHEAAYLLGAFAIFSQLLALVRDRLFASSFGAGELLDIYYAAFRIPDLVFVIVSALVSISVLIPFLVKIFSKDSADSEKEIEKKKFVDSIFSSLLIILVLLSGLVFIFADKLLALIFPEIISPDLVLITRILLLQPILLSLSSFYASFIQVYRKFFIYALGPLFYNLGIIFGVLFLYEPYGLPGLTFGVVIGALLHLAIQIPFVRSHGIKPKFTFNINPQIIKNVLKLSIPRTVALAGNQISLIVLLALAGVMVTGSISIFTFSFNLQSVPLSIVGVSYSLAAFPTLSRLFSKGDIETFLLHIVKAARHIIFWSIPISVMFVVLRAQIVRTILGAGEFSWDDTRLTAAALAIFSISVVAQGLILLFVRGYYSAGETKKPLIFTLISIVVTIISAYGLSYYFNANVFFRDFFEELFRVGGLKGTAILMLPLAYSIGQIANAILLWVSFSKKYKCFDGELWETIFHLTGASLIAGYVTFGALRVLDDVFDLDTLIGIFSQGFIAGIAGIAVGATVLVILGNQEIRTVWKTLHKKIWKSKFVGGE